MENMISGAALILILIATGSSIIYLIKQQKKIYRWSYWILFIGFLFLTTSLGYQLFSLGTAPVFTLKSSLAFFAWMIIVVYLVIQWRINVMVLGSFITPLAAVLLIISSSIPAMEVVVQPILRSFWLPIHVFTIFIGDSMFAITFMAAIMYLIQERQIKYKKRGSFYSRLPSLETLDSLNYYSLILGFPFLTLGMITGAIYAQQALGNYWRWDPKEVWSLITWLAYAILLHERIAVGWRGRKAAIMSIICFLILLFTFIGGSLWLSDYHSFKSLEGSSQL
jgi:cytochrome c-type biogenesis protein CcsB